EGRRRSAGLDEESVLDAGPVRQREHPRRPRVRVETVDALRSVGMDDVRRVALRRERERPVRSLEPRLEAVHENESSGGRLPRGQEDRVVATRTNAVDGPGREAAKTVRLEPLRLATRRQGHS